MAAKFEKFLILPDFPTNFRKSHQISKNYLKRSESYRQKPLGDPPGLNRVKEDLETLLQLPILPQQPPNLLSDSLGVFVAAIRYIDGSALL